MNRKLFAKVLSVVMLLFFMGSCSNDTNDLNDLEQALIQSDVSVSVETRANVQSFDTDWENVTEFRLKNGEIIPTPWSEKATSSHVSAFLNDMKKEDGWVMVTHNLNDSQSESNNYWKIVLYNQASGDLKIYTYSNMQTHDHNNAFWTVRFSNEQGWFNGLSEVTVPTSKKTPYSYVWKTSVQPNEDSNFVSVGWNIIVIPNMTYDPSAPSTNILAYDSYSSTTSYVEGFGSTTGTINGKIISYGGNSDNIETKIASYLGNGAKNWVTSHMSSAPSIISQGIGGLVKNGVHKILGSLFGWTSKPSYTEQDVRLNIKADSKFNASIVTLKGTGFPSGKISIDRNKTGVDLGNWNLRDNPTVYIHPVGVLYRTLRGTQSDEAEYTYAASGNFMTDIIINPQLQQHVKSYKVECFPVRYIGKKNGSEGLPQLPEAYRNSFTYGSLGALSGTSSFRCIQPADKRIYEDNDYIIYDSNAQGYSTYWRIWEKYGKASGPIPNYKYIYGPSNTDICRGGAIKLDCTYNYVKVLVTMEVEFEGKVGTVVSSRTYRPKFEWDPELMKSYGDLSMGMLQGKASSDYKLSKIDNGCYSNLQQSTMNNKPKRDEIHELVDITER